MEHSDVRITIRDCSTLKNRGIDGLLHKKTLPCFSLVQAITGSYSIAIGNGTPHRVGDGSLFITTPQTLQTIVHHTDPKTDTMYARWVFFDWEVDGVSADLLYDFPVAIPSHISMTLSRLMDSLLAAKNPYDRAATGYQLGKELLTCLAPKATPPRGDLLPVVEYIKQHFTEKITVSLLAEQIHSSESNLYALFRKQFGRSPIAYLNDYRLAVASHRLKTSADSVEAIAASVGIDDTRYFAKQFKRQYAETPSEYRKNALL